jgi:hypothetical protein
MTSNERVTSDIDISSKFGNVIFPSVRSIFIEFKQFSIKINVFIIIEVVQKLEFFTIFP